MIIDLFIVEHVVMRIETKQAPIPSQPEVVLSDGKQILFVCLNIVLILSSSQIKKNLLASNV